MTDDALSIAVEARAMAQSANQRLDRMNGSIDRLADGVAAANDNTHKILLKLAEARGAEKMRDGITLSRRFLITIVVALLGSSAFAAVLALLLRKGGHHG